MDSAEYQTLKNLAKAGIKLGYNNGLFKGSEKVTWFETIKTIAEIMKNFRGGNKQANVEPDRLATRDDILRFTDILKAKQARIRSILNRKRPYKR
jgi:tetrahydrodipicolinate N-succinyltransferase